MVAEASSSSLAALEAALLNSPGNVPLHNRFRALFTLKALKNDEAVDIISKGFADESALLKHELAYCLGQMKNKRAIPILETVLAEEKEDPMVRHEAAEALGAISSPSSISILKKYLNDPERCVRETCEIALAKIEWDNSEEGKKSLQWATDAAEQTYTSIDPAPPSSGLFAGQGAANDASPENVAKLRATLLDTSLSLFERYRAMFALRNIGTPAAVDALAAGFADDSALFKHEIAFVFGQLLSTHSVPALLAVLQDSRESEMVRHEAAEALGGIATPEVLPYLKEYMAKPDAPRVVRESCQVAMDMWEYENSDQFQYANGLGENAGTEQPVGA
ncbi:ARM repeat-containing protein [Trametes versicolor FP-101664 SS1]|uniref:ARM repeat-containing protein n=1 Tax=Trametes versicolor (strain FP-101664) TaxID=717944 RepID=UPI0004624702|nr:ARM repeat-containing protein [Trametes versicolor FP-101664 SS1]EIW59371.1 ARM repeat-containing protein [Trametes versicolor FP-101664 SS1]